MRIETLFPEQNAHVRFILGQHLKQKRLLHEMSLDALALALQVDARTYRRIESGQTNISEEQFSQLQQLLQLDSQELLEIGRIAAVSRVNAYAKALDEGYPS